MNYTASESELKDKVIIVTGAGNGIGAAVAKSYAKHGATIVLLDKNIAALELVYDEIEANGGALPALYPIDLKGASIPDYDELVAKVTENFGRLDGLIHCAAALGQLSPIEHQDPKEWLEALHINLTAPYLLSRACIPLMKKQPHASIIFTTDNYKDKAYWAGYGVAKSGIESLSKQLADEFEEEGRIRVNCVVPGPVQTTLYTRAFPAINPNDLPTPAELTPIYLYLMAEASLTENGQCLTAK